MSELEFIPEKIIYDGSKTLIDVYNSEDIENKIINVVSTMGNMLYYYWNIIPNLFKDDDNIIYPNENNQYPIPIWKSNSDGLYVVLHGLFGSPKFKGKKFTEEINKHENNYDILLPYIIATGNKSLEVVSEPIYQVVKNYIELNPTKPIHIIGSSNGCRIAAWIEVKLRKLNVDIKLTCVVGAFNGSEHINMFPMLFEMILDETIMTELSTNSDVNLELLKAMNSPIEYGMRYYDFYCTLNDWYIPNIDDCYPTMDEQPGKLIVKKNDISIGHDHVGLCWYLSNEIISKSHDWMINRK